MRFSRIFIDHVLETGSQFVLDGDSFFYITKSLRVKENSPIIFFNGNGCDYASIVKKIYKKKLIIEVIKEKKKDVEPKLEIELLQGVSKNKYMDLVIQKSVELGITSFQPVVTQFTPLSYNKEIVDKKEKHWKSIIISACEQSGRSTIPKLKNTQFFREIIKMQRNTNKIILDQSAVQSFKDISVKNSLGFCVLIGPEGGFSEDESSYAIKNGFMPVTMGNFVLRTDTAGIASIVAIQTLWGQR